MSRLYICSFRLQRRESPPSRIYIPLPPPLGNHLPAQGHPKQSFESITQEAVESYGRNAASSNAAMMGWFMSEKVMETFHLFDPGIEPWNAIEDKQLVTDQ